MADALRFMMPPIDRWLASHAKARVAGMLAPHGKMRVGGMLAPHGKVRVAGMLAPHGRRGLPECSPRPGRRLHDGFDRRRDGNVQPLRDVARARAVRGTFEMGMPTKSRAGSPGRGAVGIA
jgi:hypothetical protein